MCSFPIDEIVAPISTPLYTIARLVAVRQAEKKKKKMKKKEKGQTVIPKYSKYEPPGSGPTPTSI